MSEFVKGKSTDNSQFLKSKPVEHGNPECARLRGLSGSKGNGGGEVSLLQARFMEAFKALTKMGKRTET